MSVAAEGGSTTPTGSSCAERLMAGMNINNLEVSAPRLLRHSSSRDVLAHAHTARQLPPCPSSRTLAVLMHELVAARIRKFAVRRRPTK